MCGTFGTESHPDAANVTHLGLHALQHRGQESASMASWAERQMRVEWGMSEVSDIFEPRMLDKLTFAYSSVEGVLGCLGGPSEGSHSVLYRRRPCAVVRGRHRARTPFTIRAEEANHD